MHRNCRCSGCLCDPRDLDRIYLRCSKAFPNLDRHRFFDRAYGLTHDLLYQLRIAHQRRAFPVTGYLRHRAAHIEVEHIKVSLLNICSHLADNIRICPKQLQGYRMLRRRSLQKRHRILIMEGNGFCTHHFRADHSGTLLPAEQTKWQVTYPCHRRQYDIIFQFYISDLHEPILIQVRLPAAHGNTFPASGAAPLRFAAAP